MNEEIIIAFNNLYKKLLQSIEDYFTYIFNLPSTINKVLVYYSVGFYPSKINERYIIFNGKIIKTFYLGDRYV